MSAWGVSPWDNDAAADWFGELFESMPLAAKIEATLNLDAEDYHEEIRAAAAMLIMLGRTYVWPIEALDRHLSLALVRLEELRPLYRELGGDEWVEALDSEIEILKVRVAEGPQPSPSPPKSWTRFWSG